MMQNRFRFLKMLDPVWYNGISGSDVDEIYQVDDSEVDEEHGYVTLSRTGDSWQVCMMDRQWTYGSLIVALRFLKKYGYVLV